MSDTQRGSGTYQRPGWKCQNAGAPLIGSNRQGQCVYEHVELDGTLRRFLFVGGKMWRWNGDIGAPTFTDVTPVGVTIATSILFCESLAGKLIVNDGTNKPWIGTNLGGTPITGTYIQYNTAGA